MRKLIYLPAVIILFVSLLSCTSRSEKKKIQMKITKDSIAKVNRQDSLNFIKSLYIYGKMYFDKKEKLPISQLNYGFIIDKDNSLSIVIYPNFTGDTVDTVDAEVAERIKNIIQNKYNKLHSRWYSDDKHRLYLEVEKLDDFIDPLDVSMYIIKIIVDETKWKISYHWHVKLKL